MRRGAEGVRHEQLGAVLLVCTAREGIQERSKQIHINRWRRGEAGWFGLGGRELSSVTLALTQKCFLLLLVMAVARVQAGGSEDGDNEDE